MTNRDRNILCSAVWDKYRKHTRDIIRTKKIRDINRSIGREASELYSSKKIRKMIGEAREVLAIYWRCVYGDINV
jgi:hypothetical protein